MNDTGNATLVVDAGVANLRFCRVGCPVAVTNNHVGMNEVKGPKVGVRLGEFPLLGKLHVLRFQQGSVAVVPQSFPVRDTFAGKVATCQLLFLKAIYSLLAGELITSRQGGVQCKVGYT